MKSEVEVKQMYKEAIDESLWPKSRTQRWGLAQGAKIKLLQIILELDDYGNPLKKDNASV